MNLNHIKRHKIILKKRKKTNLGLKLIQTPVFFTECFSVARCPNSTASYSTNPDSSVLQRMLFCSFMWCFPFPKTQPVRKQIDKFSLLYWMALCCRRRRFVLHDSYMPSYKWNMPVVFLPFFFYLFEQWTELSVCTGYSAYTGYWLLVGLMWKFRFVYFWLNNKLASSKRSKQGEAVA